MELGIVKKVYPIDDVEYEEEDGKHDDSVALDFEQDLLLLVFSLQDSILLFILNVFSG